VAGEGWEHGDVHDAGELASPAPDLARLDAEEVGQLIAPLLGQDLSVDEDQGGGSAFGDDGAGHDGLAGSGWRDQYAIVVREHGAHGGGLVRLEGRGELDVDLVTGVTDVRQGEANSGSFDDDRDRVPKAAGGGREAAILDIAQDLLLRELHDNGALDALVFKGGTALRKLYAGNQGRFSLDLDFSLATPTDPDVVVLDLVSAIDGTTIGPFTCGVSERRGKWSLTVTSPYGDDATLSSKLDVSPPDLA
jgi:Nucleotidyl transferase AbiEii toxin, Type IV TA system